MTRWTRIDLLLMAVALMLAAMAMLAAAPAHAHAWYSQRQDPVYNNGCCGGSDCRELNGRLIKEKVLEAEESGYRIRLTLLQSRLINNYSALPIDALVTWDRIQESEDNKFHLCIFNVDRTAPRNGVICLFAPPSM